MPNIEVNFNLFFPSPGGILSFFEILKDHQFIRDVKVVKRDGISVIQVFRKDGGKL